jgi:predicted metal-dependent peptidase
MSFDLSFHIHRLLRKEPFFASFSRKVEKIADESIPTAAIGYNRETHRFVLLYNPDFFDSLSDIEKAGVLKHEFYHLILGHLVARLPFDPRKEPGKAKMWNVATDLAINSHLVEELPKMACIPGVKPFENYAVGCTSEAYFRELQKNEEEGTGPYAPGDDEGDDEGGEDTGPDSMDDHSHWGETQGESAGAEIAREKLKEMTKEAVKAVEESNRPSRNWGSVPHEYRIQIQKSIAPTISPEAVLRYFIKTSAKSTRTSTIRRINPRYPYIHPGRKVKRVANIAISIDQSGSVNDNMLQLFFSFLNKLASIATFTVVPFDSTVCEESIYVWKRGETRKWERVRYGGTCFDAPTRWVNQRNFDGHIIITDMQAPKPIASKCQRLWITDSINKRYRYFQTNEKVLAIDA